MNAACSRGLCRALLVAVCLLAGALAGVASPAGSDPLALSAGLPPVAHAGADQTLEATGPRTRIDLDGGGSTAAAGGALTFEWVDLSTGAVVGTAAACICEQAVGTVVYRLRVTDAGGQSGTDTVAVTVCDTTPPAITVLPAVLNLDDYAGAGTLVELACSNTCAVDLVDGSVPVQVYTFPLPYAAGPQPVGLSARDTCGNTSYGSFLPAVVDTTPPTFDYPAWGITPPHDLLVAATAPDGAVVTWAPVLAYDKSSPSPLVAACLPASGTVFPLGTTVVDCLATDPSGNTTTASFTVTVLRINHAPAADTRAVTTVMNRAVNITLQAADADGDRLTYRIITKPAHGTLTNNAGGAKLVYLPAPGYVGADCFTFVAHDGTVDSNLAAVPITVGTCQRLTIRYSGTVTYYTGSGWAPCPQAGLLLPPDTYWLKFDGRMTSIVVPPGRDVVKTVALIRLRNSAGAALAGAAATLRVGAGPLRGLPATDAAGETLAVLDGLVDQATVTVRWAATEQILTQPLATHAVFAFRTGRVHSASGTCTGYAAGSWKAFTQDMELLPGAYPFRFAAGAPQEQVCTVLPGVTNTIR